jgi:5-carboxymethyl-2-hydroxymuconate isomerase
MRIDVTWVADHVSGRDLLQVTLHLGANRSAVQRRLLADYLRAIKALQGVCGEVASYDRI